MPLSINDADASQDDDNVDVLADVKLIAFEAKPASIGPFGASTLRWKVEGPAGFHVNLSGVGVPQSGTHVVQPAATSTYNLIARAGRASRTLGHVIVSVDTAACEAFEVFRNPVHTIEAALTTFVQSDRDVYFRLKPSGGFWGTPQISTPKVSFAPGKISFSLRLGKREDRFPNPSVDIDVDFGMTVTEGKLVAIGEQVNVSVSVPFWVWGLPGAIPALAIALDGGRETARKAAHKMVDGLVQIMNFSATPPQGKRLRTVSIDDGSNDNGVIEVTACPYDLLLKLAAMSDAVPIH